MGEQQMPAFAGQGLSPGHVPQGQVSLSGSEAPLGEHLPRDPCRWAPHRVTACWEQAGTGEFHVPSISLIALHFQAGTWFVSGP